jgi:hypothetical protein
LQSSIAFQKQWKGKGVGMSALSQITAMLAFGPPYEVNGLVYPTQPTVDTDCLVFTPTGPSIPGIVAGTVLRAVIPVATIKTFRGRNA